MIKTAEQIAYSAERFSSQWGIESTLDLRATLRKGPYTWPGGYPLFFITSDGDALSFDSVRENYREISQAIRSHSNCGWRVVGCDANWEDSNLYCAHSNEKIECAYDSDIEGE